ncbi:hypothetical protein MXD81_23575, partial [Microbacteriaceae bacterium K1510]|nr:hypothetical protein [Microbacteriaceae bacterium K1510]
AYQIGTAIKRTKLFHSQQRRAEMYTKLGEIVKRFGQITSASKIPAEAVAWLGKSFQWHSVAFFVQEANILSLRALCAEGKVMNQWNSIVPTESGPVGAAIGKGRLEKLVSNRTNYPKLLELGVPAFSSAV